MALQLAETMRISLPTVIESMRGKLTHESSDLRLKEWAQTALSMADLELKVRGLEHLESGRACLLMSNHQSTYDVFALFVAFPGTLRMIAKKETFKLPIMGEAMRAAGFVEVDRGDREKAIKSLERAKEAMTSGVNIWIAPEGTRSEDGNLLPFKKGGFIMAMQAGVDILPVTIDGSRHTLPAKDHRVYGGHQTRVTFHPPIDSQAFGPEGRDQLMEAVRASIQSGFED